MYNGTWTDALDQLESEGCFEFCAAVLLNAKASWADFADGDPRHKVDELKDGEVKADEGSGGDTEGGKDDRKYPERWQYRALRNTRVPVQTAKRIIRGLAKWDKTSEAFATARRSIDALEDHPRWWFVSEMLFAETVTEWESAHVARWGEDRDLQSPGSEGTKGDAAPRLLREVPLLTFASPTVVREIALMISAHLENSGLTSKESNKDRREKKRRAVAKAIEEYLQTWGAANATCFAEWLGRELDRDGTFDRMLDPARLDPKDKNGERIAPEQRGSMFAFNLARECFPEAPAEPGGAKDPG